jgi:putative transposase
VTRSGYYAWKRRQQAPLGQRQAENALITAEIQAVFQEHRGFYGSPRIHQELRATGRSIGRHRVARLMQRAGLRAKTRRAFRPCSKASGANGVAENLLEQDFTPPAPNRYWAGDITYIRTTSGWRYQAVWMDLFSRRVVGWSLGTSMEASLVLEAHGITCSMSGKGCCWDNAVVESLFSTLKHELGLDDDAVDRIAPKRLQRDLAFWIDGYYNRERRHSTLSYLSPNDDEQQFMAARTLTHVDP